MTSSTPDVLWASPASALLRPTAVSCEGVAHSLDGRPVLTSIDLSVTVGTRLLITGRRGSGSTLLMRILAGLVKPDRGTIRIAGLPAGEGTEWRRRVGYVPAELSAYPWLTMAETLGVAARLHGLSRAQGERRGADLAARVGIAADQLATSVGRATPVQRERLALAAALVHDPEVLLLDQPLASIDPRERTALLADAAQGRTVLLRSRLPGRERDVCERVAFIRNGRVALEAAVSDLEAAAVALSLSGLEAFAARKK